MPEELSALELIASCASNVMGWQDTEHGDIMAEIGPVFFLRPPSGDYINVFEKDKLVRLWNPLASMDDAEEIIKVMRSRGFKYSRVSDSQSETARFVIEDNVMCDVHSGFALPFNPGEAILRAALVAVRPSDAH